MCVDDTENKNIDVASYFWKDKNCIVQNVYFNHTYTLLRKEEKTSGEELEIWNNRRELM